MQTIISYLIPSYNHESYLPLLLQTLSKDIASLKVRAEVIILDDGSRDNSVNLIKTWVGSQNNAFKISCIFQENKGLSAALNKMISTAQGVYLRLCASDDLIKVGSTQKLYDQALQSPQLLAVFADAEVIDEKGKLIHASSIAFHGGRVKHLLNPVLMTKELIQHWCVAGPSHLVKKAHYQQMHYNETSRIDDYDLFLSLLEKPNSLLFINEIACQYRIHQSNTSKTRDKDRRIENIGFFLDIINKYSLKPRLAKDLWPVKYQTKAKIYYLKSNYFRSLACILFFFFLKIKYRS